MSERIVIGHGSGGKLMHELIKEFIAPVIGLKEFGDSAILNVFKEKKIAFTTDSYVVSPLFFPGGNIGNLAINGTINDLAVVGAEPLFISIGLIIEEGFEINLLKKIIFSIKDAADKAGIKVVTGDTKVVNKGKGDGIFINTSGIGLILQDIDISPKKIVPTDKVIVSGSIGDHGIAVMAKRNGLIFNPPIISDTQPLNGLIKEILLSYSGAIHAMRDPTRGGLATTLKEIAQEASVCIEVEEDKIPIKQQVRGACELLGLDPLYVASEGVIVAFVSENMAKCILAAMKKHPFGKDAEIIGEVKLSPKGMVLMKTKIGGIRIIEMLTTEQLPRIC